MLALTQPYLKVMRQENRLDFIDALRGIAILGVLLVHASVFSHQRGLFQSLGLIGNRGVQLFYVVSAFTLFLSLDSAESERHKWSNFYIRRFFRIAPLYYVAIVLNLIIHVGPRLSRIETLSGFVFLNGLSPRAIGDVAPGGWSIADESSFYFIIPVLFMIAKNLRRSVALFIVAAIVAGGISFYLASLPQFGSEIMQFYFRMFWFPVELPVFLLGISAYFVWKHHSQRLHSVDPVLLIVASFFLFFIGLSVEEWGLYLSSISFVGLVVALSIRSSKLLVNDCTKFLGKISYSMYLMHFFVLYAIQRMHVRLPPTIVGFVAAYILVFVGTVPVSWLTFKYIEQPGIRLGRNWIRRREANKLAGYSPNESAASSSS